MKDKEKFKNYESKNHINIKIKYNIIKKENY